MSTKREVKEGTLHQGEDEQIAYTLTTTPWGSTPTSVTVVAKDVTNKNEVVTSTVLSGGSSTTGDIITLPTLQSLTRDHTYRVEVKFTAGGNVWEAWFTVEAER